MMSKMLRLVYSVNLGRISKTSCCFKTIGRCESTNSISPTTSGVNTIEVNTSEEALMELENEIERKRNKSRLNPHHLNILRGRPPYGEQEIADFHHTLKYKRKMFGKYGSQSGIDPGALWPTKEELKEIKDYEKVAYPHSFQEMREQEIQKLKYYQEFIAKRQQKLAENMKKLDKWKKELDSRAAKKLADAALAKKRKDDLIEEVRRHFGFKIDSRDERFKELFLQKEKEQKKKLKEEKAKVKHEKQLASMTEKELA